MPICPACLAWPCSAAATAPQDGYEANTASVNSAGARTLASMIQPRYAEVDAADAAVLYSMLLDQPATMLQRQQMQQQRLAVVAAAAASGGGGSSSCSHPALLALLADLHQPCCHAGPRCLAPWSAAAWRHSALAWAVRAWTCRVAPRAMPGSLAAWPAAACSPSSDGHMVQGSGEPAGPRCG
jgi:hypothetical protein